MIKLHKILRTKNVPITIWTTFILLHLHSQQYTANRISRQYEEVELRRQTPIKNIFCTKNLVHLDFPRSRRWIIVVPNGTMLVVCRQGFPQQQSKSPGLERSQVNPGVKKACVAKRKGNIRLLVFFNRNIIHDVEI